jgi:uncharacterized protein
MTDRHDPDRIQANLSGSFNRRDFLRTSTIAAIGAAAGLGAGFGAAAAAGDKLTVNGLPGVIFGRTGLKINPISFGGILITEPPVLLQAIERGFKLVHTSPEYQNGKSLEAFGKVMKTHRKKVVLAVKERPEKLDAALKVLNTDYVDMLLPPMDTVEALEDPTIPENFVKMKKAGKVGFMGFACHTDNVIKVLDRARELGYYDCALLGFHMPMVSDPGVKQMVGPERIKQINEAIAKNSGAPNFSQDFVEAVRKAREAGMGILTMKGLPKRQSDDPKPEMLDLIASLCTSMVTQWHASSVLASMGSFQAVDTYRNILETKLGFRDPVLEERYWAGLIGNYCGACGNCRGVCPQGVEVQRVLRYRMYHNDYNLKEYARTKYAALPAGGLASACLDCGRCEEVCSRRLPVRAMLVEADRLLA